MIDLKGYEGFVLLRNDKSKEAQAITIVSTLQKIPCIRINKGEIVSREQFVPCGSVEFCENLLGYHPIPNYFPKFLYDYINRKIWYKILWPHEEKLFIKPSDRYKRFTGFVKAPNSYKGKKRGPYCCSEIVVFENEWRYYISYGKVLCAEWYWGNEELCPDAPDINHIKIPETFCGTLDFGEIKGRGFSLVEAHHPYACGWYGKDHEKYAQWLIDGWIYMKS